MDASEVIALPSERRGLKLNSLMFALAVVAIEIGFVVVRSSFRKIFEDMGMPLPLLTRGLVEVPDLVCAIGGLYAAGFLMLKDFWLPPLVAARIQSVCAVLLLGGLGMAVIGLFMPLNCTVIGLR